jgi:hypothetical protein
MRVTLIQISIFQTVASLVLVATPPSIVAPLKKSSDTVTSLYTLLTELRKFQAAPGLPALPADASIPHQSSPDKATYGSSGFYTVGSAIYRYQDE